MDDTDNRLDEISAHLKAHREARYTRVAQQLDHADDALTRLETADLTRAVARQTLETWLARGFDHTDELVRAAEDALNSGDLQRQAAVLERIAIV